MKQLKQIESSLALAVWQCRMLANSSRRSSPSSAALAVAPRSFLPVLLLSRLVKSGALNMGENGSMGNFQGHLTFLCSEKLKSLGIELL